MAVASRTWANASTPSASGRSTTSQAPLSEIVPVAAVAGQLDMLSSRSLRGVARRDEHARGRNDVPTVRQGFAPVSLADHSAPLIAPLDIALTSNARLG